MVVGRIELISIRRILISFNTRANASRLVGHYLEPRVDKIFVLPDCWAEVFYPKTICSQRKFAFRFLNCSHRTTYYPGIGTTMDKYFRLSKASPVQGRKSMPRRGRVRQKTANHG